MRTNTIYISRRVILRGRYAEEGETHVVSEAELAELQAIYPDAVIAGDSVPVDNAAGARDMTEPAFDPTLAKPVGAMVLQDDSALRDANNSPSDMTSDAGGTDDAEGSDDDQPGGDARKGGTRRAGAKRTA